MPSGGSRAYLTPRQVDMLDSLAAVRQWWTAIELADDLGETTSAVSQRLATLKRRKLASVGTYASHARGRGRLWRITREGREALAQTTQPGDYPARGEK